MKWLFILPVMLYRATVSRVLPRICRFDPTCAEYTHVALLKHGAWKGLLLGLKRIGSCHPWGRSGIDPVPGDDNESPLPMLWPPRR